MAKISFGDPFTRVRKVESVSKTTVLNERVQHVYSRNPTNGQDYIVGEIVKERNGHSSFLGIRLFNVRTQNGSAVQRHGLKQGNMHKIVLINYFVRIELAIVACLL